MNLSSISNAAKLGLTVAVALVAFGLSSMARADLSKIPPAAGFLGSGRFNIGPNRSGEAVHGMSRPNSSGRIWAYRNEQLPTLSLNEDECVVTKINEAGNFVGYRRHTNGIRAAFINKRNGQIVDLGTTPSSRPYTGLSPIAYPFRDRTAVVTSCGRVCLHNKKINVSQVFQGQTLGLKEVEEDTWLISFMDHDLGDIDLEERSLQPLDNPFGAIKV